METEIKMSVGKEAKVRLQWDIESMTRAVEAVKVHNKGLRQAAREHGVPVTTLKRRVDDEVAVDSRPGPETVLTSEEEKKLFQYILDMGDMGYGLTIEDVRTVAFRIAENSGRKHPFNEGKAGRDWYAGFCRCHSQLVLRKPEALSYSRAKCANAKTVEDFFAKLGALYARLNILSKPMLIYNADETGISKVHKQRTRVLARRGQKVVWELTSGERGRTHTLVVCGSASGYALPPLMIFPRVRVGDKLKSGAPPGTIFEGSPKGWINKDIFYRWMDFFIANIPSARPVLLIYDGHASHISMEVIEKARKNDIHLLCLPSHCSHILQPLDVSIMSSLKLHFSKVCRRFLVNNAGRVITEQDLAGLVGEAWPLALTPSNIIAGFCKSGIYPLNPGRISDRLLGPSKPFIVNNSDSQSPKSLPSPRTTRSDSLTTRADSNPPSLPSTTSESIDDILSLPQMKTPPKRKQRSALTSTAQCLTDTPFIDKLKEKATTGRKTQPEKKKPAKKEPAKKKQATPKITRYGTRTAARRRKSIVPHGTKQKETMEDNKCNEMSDDEDCECSLCGVRYGTEDGVVLWISCDLCSKWMHTKCAQIINDNIPEVFQCQECSVP